MERLEGRHAFVTGGASGIGLGITHALVEAGARVTIADRDASAASAAVATAPDHLHHVVLDTRDRAAWAGAKDDAEQRFGPVDILVNNAGIGPDGHDLADTDPAAFDRVIDINVTGVFNGIATFAPALRDRGSGHIVSTASFGGLSTSGAGAGAYVGAKFAVVAMSEVLRNELEPFGVGVSVLCPSAVRTNLHLTTVALGSEASPIAFGTELSHGIPIDEVGRRVVDGIRANALYIFSHPGEPWRSMLVQRWDRLIGAFDATVPTP